MCDRLAHEQPACKDAARICQLVGIGGSTESQHCGGHAKASPEAETEILGRDFASTIDTRRESRMRFFDWQKRWTSAPRRQIHGVGAGVHEAAQPRPGRPRRHQQCERGPYVQVEELLVAVVARRQRAAQVINRLHSISRGRQRGLILQPTRPQLDAREPDQLCSRVLGQHKPPHLVATGYQQTRQVGANSTCGTRDKDHHAMLKAVMPVRRSAYRDA